ncbi:hypothetical protein D1872_328760 [compost metagenome]
MSPVTFPTGKVRESGCSKVRPGTRKEVLSSVKVVSDCEFLSCIVANVNVLKGTANRARREIRSGRSR